MFLYNRVLKLNTIKNAATSQSFLSEGDLISLTLSTIPSFTAMEFLLKGLGVRVMFLLE